MTFLFGSFRTSFDYIGLAVALAQVVWRLTKLLEAWLSSPSYFLQKNQLKNLILCLKYSTK